MVKMIPQDESDSTLEDVVRVIEKKVALLDHQSHGTTHTTVRSSTSSLSIKSVPELSSYAEGPPEPLSKPTVVAAATKPKRRIRFASQEACVVGFIPTVAELSPRERHACWWRPKDFECFRLAAKELACSARIEGRKTLMGVDDGYIKASYLAITTQEHAMVTNMSCEKIARHCHGLKAWAVRPHTCRGLEHWISKDHWGARNEVMDEARLVVLELSGYGEPVEEIAKQYQEYNRSARILARLKGHADEEAVQQATQEDDCSEAFEHMVY